MARLDPPAWTHPFLYGAVRAGAAGVGAVGLDPSHDLLRRLGGWWARTPWNRGRVARAEANIAWCFPAWERERVRGCADEAYRLLFSLPAEMAFTPRMLSEDGWPSRIRIGDMKGAIELLAHRRPCLLITGHCGAWELLGSTLGALGFPVHALYRPMDIPPLDAWTRESRARHGLGLISKFGAAEDLPPLLERGEPIGFIADQNAGRRGLFVPFFDRLASTYKTIGLLAMRYEAPIVCGQARRLGGADAGRICYEIDVVDVIHPEDWRSQPDPLFYVTARYRRAIETMVRRAPEQYLWMHKYWKSRPRFEEEGRPFPAALREKIRALPWMTGASLERIEERSARDAADLARGRAGEAGRRAAGASLAAAPG